MVLKSAERFNLTLEVDMHSMTVILIKDGKEGRTYDASQYFQYFVEYGVRKADVVQLQEHFSIEYFQNMLVTGENSEIFEFCVQFVGEDYKILECKIKLVESQNSNIIKIVLEDISHKRVQQLVYIKNHFAQRQHKSYAKPFDITFEEEKNNSVEKQKNYKYIIIMISILCVIMSIVVFKDIYFLHTNKLSDNNLSRCKTTSQCIEQQLNFTSLNLTTFNNIISNMETEFTKAKLINYVELEKNEYGYEAMAFIDENDKILYTDVPREYGNISYLENIFNYEKKERFAITADNLNGNVLINYIIPAEGLTIDGVKNKAIMASFDLNKICDRVFDTINLKPKEYMIINDKGDILWGRSSEISKNLNQQNYFNYLNKSFIKIKSEDGLETLHKNLARKKGGTFYYRKNGKINFVAYVPLEIQGLYLVRAYNYASMDCVAMKLLIIFMVILLIILMIPILILIYQIKTIKEKKNDLEEIVYCDGITGGMNSNYFDQEAKHFIGEMDSPYALVVTNLRNFNLYNTKYGHVRGDELIRRLFLGISKYIDNDELLCRIYAEHMIILMKYKDEKQLENRLINIGKCIIDTSFILEFGICIIRDLNLDIEVAKERAIMSLKNETKVQKNNIVITYYDVKLLERIMFEKELENTMYSAFRKGEFKIVVEPRYNLKTRSLCNGDASAVWNHPEKGALMPDQYMGVFQRRGLIMCLDCFIFEEICKKIKGHLDNGRTGINISITLHRNHFNITDFINKFRRIKDRYGIPGKCFSFEISEEIIYEKMYQIESIVECIHEMGANCTMGKYRGRYLPLESLCKIGIDTIKFDEELLAKKLPDEMVMALIKIAKAVNAKTVMTAVSKQSQILYLSKAECDEAKGDAFAKNISLDEYINIF